MRNVIVGCFVNNKNMKIKDVLILVFGEQDFKDGMILETKTENYKNDSDFVEDWKLFNNKKDAIDNYLEFLMKEILDVKNKNLIKKYINYNKLYKEVSDVNTGYYEIGDDLKLENDWILCDVKKYNRNNKAKTLVKVKYFKSCGFKK